MTIVTVCRNAATTIEATIRSVIEQDYPHIEYIIVDAESQDGTADIIEKYRDKVSLWIREPDKGIADAWNKGIRNASGDIIGLISADDRYAPGAISTVVDVFQREKGCGFVYGDLEVVNGNGRGWHLEKGQPGYEGKTLYDMLHVPHPTVFVRKEIYDRIGLFSTDYRIASDYEFVRRMAFFGIKGACIPQILAIMRQDGVSHRDRTAAYGEVRKISVRYGARVFPAELYFRFKLVRTYLGILADLLGIDATARRRIRHRLKRVREQGEWV